MKYKNKSNEKMKIDNKKAEQLRKKGMSYDQIAQKLNCTASGVYYALNPGKNKGKDWKKYYDKERHREYMAKYRAKLK